MEINSGIRRSSRLASMDKEPSKSLNLSKDRTVVRKYITKSSGEKNMGNPKCSLISLSNIVDPICNKEKSHAYKPKLPIWDSKERQVSNISLKHSRRSSKRLSVQKKEGIYDFQAEFNSCNSDSKVNKVIRKPRNKRPRKKFKSTIKSTLLTTDLTWETLLNKNLPVNKLYKCQTDNKSTIQKDSNDLPHFHVSDSLSFDEEIDEGGYEASISMDYEVNDTNSTSNLEKPVQILKNKLNNCGSMSSKFGLTVPSPNITGRFFGPTSTPRGDYTEKNIVHEPVCVQDDMKICFGFDYSEEYNLGFSPVQRSHQISIPLMSDFILSDTGDIDPQPTRFAVPYCSRPPLAQVQNYGRQNKAKVDSEKYSKVKQKKYLNAAPLNNISNLVKNKLPVFPVEASDCSILFGDTEEENMDQVSTPMPPKCPIVSEVKMSLCQMMPSPQKNFKMPPRKSYSRESLENSKIKFNAALAGYSTTGSDTEANENEVLRKKVITKRKKKRSIVKSSLQIKSSKSYTKLSKHIGKLKGVSEKENLPRKDQINKKNESQSDNSIDNWASDLNSHFSEVEDMELVCEQNPKILEHKSTEDHNLN